jgi:hypothetical protein
MRHRRKGHGILSAFAARKECQRCHLVIVNRYQLIESRKLQDLRHSRLRAQEDRFGPTTIQRFGNGQEHPQAEGGEKSDFRHVQKERLCSWDRVAGEPQFDLRYSSGV